MIDLSDSATWSAEVIGVVEPMADSIATHPEFDRGAPARELFRLALADHEQYERAVRTVLGETPVAMYHATRLLPHERAWLSERGLQPLSTELREQRLAGARRMHPDLIDDEELELLATRGPLNWNREHAQRLGQICLVSPLSAVEADVTGLSEFFGKWGGESIFWSENGPFETRARCSAIVARLSELSSPTLVVAAVPANRVVRAKWLWPNLVAARLGMQRLDGVWYVEGGPPLEVAALISPGDSLWNSSWVAGSGT